MKSRLLQLTTSPSVHQGESLHFIGAHPWHVKDLVGKVVWIAIMNKVVSTQTRRPPMIYHHRTSVVEISVKIQIQP